MRWCNRLTRCSSHVQTFPFLRGLLFLNEYFCLCFDFLNLPWDSILFELAALSGLVVGEGGGAGARGSPPRQLPARPAPAGRAARVEPGRPAVELGLRVPLWAGGRAGSLEAASESGEGAPRRFVSPLLEPGGPLLPRPAAGAPGGSGSGGGGGIGSSFTPFPFLPLPHRLWRRRQRRGKADPSPSHTEGSSWSRLAA